MKMAKPIVKMSRTFKLPTFEQQMMVNRHRGVPENVNIAGRLIYSAYNVLASAFLAIFENTPTNGTLFEIHLLVL
jgi:hypothetical protein